MRLSVFRRGYISRGKGGGGELSSGRRSDRFRILFRGWRGLVKKGELNILEVGADTLEDTMKHENIRLLTD